MSLYPFDTLYIDPGPGGSWSTLAIVFVLLKSYVCFLQKRTIGAEQRRALRLAEVKKVPSMTIKRAITVTVNGKQHQSEIEPRLLLVHYLRDILDLTGTHVGCNTSQCGACVVLLNGEAVKSCTVLAIQADGSEVTTIEGLATGETLHPIQEGFWEKHGLQCGFCTPGMIMASYQLLKNNPNPTETEIRKGLEGNICRCTGYQNIVSAVQDASARMQASSKTPVSTGD